jgi:hypothetical protein
MRVKLAQGPPAAIVQSALSKLSPDRFSSFHNLSYIEPPGGFDPDDEHAPQVALAIFQTNAVVAGEAVGLFPRMARLNHGCAGAFNAVYSWREHESVVVVYAMKPIRKGEVCHDLLL